MMLQVKPGDVLTRRVQWHDGRCDDWNAEVLEVSENVIKCGVIVDTYRTMEFDRETGIAVIGWKFGYLVEVLRSE